MKERITCGTARRATTAVLNTVCASRPSRIPAHHSRYFAGGVSPISPRRSFMSSHTGFFASGFRSRYEG